MSLTMLLELDGNPVADMRLKHRAEIIAVAYFRRTSILCSMRIETATLALHRSSKKRDLLLPVWLDTCT